MSEFMDAIHDNTRPVEVGPCCGSCRYSYTTPRGTMICRRFPPQLSTASDRYGTNIFSRQPEIVSENWCGEFERDRAVS